MPLIAGTRLGPYEILSPLGAGGMGEVWKAKDMRLDRFVAVKVLPEHLTKQLESLVRFEREAKAVAALNHPNILGIHDFATHGEAPYVVMELLEGESLRARLDQGPIQIRKAIELVLQVAQGLAAAHEKGIVHRDLKPENLWVTKEGRIKILDFGLAKQIAAPHSDAPKWGAQSSLSTGFMNPDPAHHTQEGTVLGTVGYMSPEQVRGEVVDARSDIFTFGILLFEMLTGQRPFKGDTAVQTMAAILEQDPPELSTSRGPVPQGLESILGHCLEKRPEARFQSMKDIAFNLQNINSVSLPKSTNGMADAIRKARWRTLIFLTGVTVVIGLALGFTGLLHLGKLDDPPVFRRLTYFRGTLDRAAFANNGQTVIYSARVDGQPSSLYSFSTRAAEPARMGLPGTFLLSVSAGNDLLVHRNPMIWGEFNLGTLAQATQSGAGLREIREGVFQADWAPGAQAFAVVRIGESTTFTQYLEFPLGNPIYHTSGRLRNLRVSPDGKQLLFLEIGMSPGAEVLLQVLGPAGKVETLAKGNSVGSAIWESSGREIWVSEIEGGQTSLVKLSLSGKKRTIWRGAGTFELQGMDGNGNLLLSLQQTESQVETIGDDAVYPRNLSWLNSTQVFGFSPDSQTLLFNESNSGGGNLSGIYLRRANEPTPVRLGSDTGTDVSSDGRMVLGVTPSGQFRIIHTGAGTNKNLDTGPGIGTEGWFFPDGRKLLLDKLLPNKITQMVIHDLDQNTSTPAAPPGFTCFNGQRSLSPDGTRMALYFRDPKTSEVTVWIFSVNGMGRTQVPGLRQGERVQTWTKDGRGLYVFDRSTLPATIDRLDITTGRREPWKVFMPADPAGIRGISSFEISRDGRHVAFNYKRVLTQLFLVEGLK